MKTEREIIAILNKEIKSSTGFIGGEIVNRRKKSLVIIYIYKAIKK